MSEAPRGLRALRALRQRWASPQRAPSSAAEPSPAEPPKDQGTEWSDFIKKELDREYTRRDTLNTRAAGAITSATTLITVSLAVIGIAKGAHYVIDGLMATVLLGFALLFLLVAAVLSILAGAVGGEFKVAAVNDLNRMLSAELWPVDTIDARYYTAQLNILATKTLRAGNTTKYRYLVIALVVQAIGVSLLALFAMKVIFG